MKVLKVILAIGFTVLEILFFINYYNVIYRTGKEISFAILIIGLIAHGVLSWYADNVAYERYQHRTFWENLGGYTDEPAYLSRFIQIVEFFIDALFSLSLFLNYLTQPQKALFVIVFILMIINTTTSVVAIRMGRY